MLRSAHTKRLALAVAVTAMMASAVMSGSATADPKQLGAAVGVGSDTTQDVMNALAGFSNGVNYTPVQSSSGSGARQLISFDATPPAGVADSCVTVKTGAPTFTRPNGSTQGRRALSRAIDGTGYGSAACGGVQNVSGLVQFARSSSGPAAGDTGTNLTYIPFGRDGMSFAAYRANGAPVTTLSRAQLTSLFTTGPQVIGGVRIVPCGIQLGSGTYAFWQTVTTATAAQEDAATAECNALVPNAATAGRAQESNGPELAARGVALAANPATANDQVIIGFSAGQYIARSNGAASPAPGVGVEIGSISDNGSGVNLGSPVSGTAPNMVPVQAFFDDATFGRSVYNVFATSIITSLAGNNDLKTMFVGPTSSVCLSTTVIQKFGFTVHPSCGSTATKGSLISGQL